MNEGLTKFLATSCYSFGKDRDDHIVKLIKKGRAFTRKQIEDIIMVDRKSSKRIAQYALARLCRQERIKKKVYAPQLPSVYFVGKRPINIEHTLMINEVYCELLKQKSPGVTVEFKWSYSILDGIVFADAMVDIFIEPGRKDRKVVFIEIERCPSKRFNKPEQYQKIYDSDWTNEEWAVIKDRTAIFPTILVVTDFNPPIKSELNFIVASIDEIKKDVYSILRR